MPARRYELRVTGRLSPMARTAFGGMDVDELSAETVITGTVDDSQQLVRVLDLVQSVGLRVVSITQVTAGPAGP